MNSDPGIFQFQPNEDEAQLAQDIVELRSENERLRALLREIASFMEADPPDLRSRRREWQAERDAFVERAREAL